MLKLILALAATAAGASPQSDFPVNLMGVQCFGMGSTTGGSQEECASRCSQDPQCRVYSYCPPDSLACGKQV